MQALKYSSFEAGQICKSTALQIFSTTSNNNWGSVNDFLPPNWNQRPDELQDDSDIICQSRPDLWLAVIKVSDTTTAKWINASCTY